MSTLDEYFLVVTCQKIVTFQWTRDLDMPSILTRAKADLSSSFLARKTMFYLPHTPSTSPQLIYFPFLILLFIFNLYPWPYIYRTWTPHRPYMDPTLTLPLTVFSTSTATTTFFIISLSTTTTTFLLFSFHHRHHHIFIVFPPLPAPPHFYCFLSTTATTTLLLFSLHYRHISIVFPPQPPPLHFHCCLPPPSPPPHFYCFPSTTTTATTFLLFSFHHQITLKRGGKTIEMWR